MPTSAAASPDPSRSRSRSLYDLVLPGTHDSAAYSARPELVSRSTILPLHIRHIRRAVASVQTDFALTQTVSVLQQLRAGARFLDIRVSKRPHSSSDKSFWTVHGMVLCVPLADIIAQINQFHDENLGHPAPTVVTVFRSQLLDSDEEDDLARFVWKSFKHPVFDGDRAELRDIPYVNLPPNVVAGVKGAKLDVAWGQDPWLDTYSAEKKIAFLRKTLAATKHRDLRNDLLVLGWTVTPSVWDVTFRVLSFGSCRPSVVTEALKMNERFLGFLSENKEAMAQRTNVVFFDGFPDKHAEMIQQLNKELDNSDDSAS